MPTRTIKSLERAFGLYADLAEALPSDAFTRHLADLPSNTVGQQLWCVIGARESYGHAIEDGEWQGFACSLSDEGTADQTAVSQHLRASADSVRALLADAESLSDQQNAFVLDLIGHEAQHQGQLIRYLYGLELAIPASWKCRWALD